MLEGYKILDFFLRLYVIFEINFLLTGDLNFTAFGDLVSYILILFVSGQAYLIHITAWRIVINFTRILIGIYTGQGILTYVFVCQSLMVFFPSDEWLGRFRAVRLLFPTILATFAGLFLKLHYHDLTIALCFFMAGYELDMHEKLRQSFREVRNPLVHVGIVITIKRLYKERQIGLSLKVFWLILSVVTLLVLFIGTGFSYNEILKYEILVFFSVGSNNILQYFALFLVSVDVACIVLWTVEAILKWSVRDRVDAIEIGRLENRIKIKDDVFLVFGMNFLYALIHAFILPQPYRRGAFLCLNMCCLHILLRVSKLCNETLQILSTSLLGNIWTHVRAILSTFLLCLLIYVSWPKLFLNPFLSYLMADALVQTLKTLVVYILAVYDFLSSNGIEQLEEKVYLLEVMANTFTIGGAIATYIILMYDPEQLHQQESFIRNISEHLLVTTAYLAIIGIPARKAWNSWQQRRTDAKILNKLADATKKQTKKQKDENECCAICRKFMSSAKVTQCGHYFHYNCLRNWLHNSASDTCPMCKKPMGLIQEKNEENVTTCKEIDHTENHEEKPTKHCTKTNEDKHYTWFKDTFLDSRRKLKKEIYQKLTSFSWLCGAFGLTGPNNVIGRPHLFLTVKREMDRLDVLRELKEKFSCEDPDEYFELLEEPERKPTFKHLGNTFGQPQNGAVVGGRVLAYTPWGAAGTLTMFCCKDGQHYALTCFHVGCGTALTKNDNIREISERSPRYRDHAERQSYCFNNIDRPLGDFKDGDIDYEWDILCVRIPDDVEIDCTIADVPNPNWDQLWMQLYERVVEKKNQVKVEKICLSSPFVRGKIVETAFSYKEKDGRVLFNDTTVVKGDSGSFLKDGDSGSLVYFLDEEEQKMAFAYGVMEADELDLADGTSIKGPFAICLNLETALEKLNLKEAGCFNVCGQN